MLAIPLTGATSTLIRPRRSKLHHSSADNFSRSCRTSVAVCCSRTRQLADKKRDLLLQIGKGGGCRGALPLGALLHTA